MLAGGTESCVGAVSLAGFSRARALSTRRHDDPGAASRPFDAARDGFVLGEGAGALVLEELESARRRGAHIYAELRGFGLSSDAHHITAPREGGDGPLRAMRAALHEGGLSPSDVDHVNAHATGTPLGDVVELQALARLFSARGACAGAPAAAGAADGLADAAPEEDTPASAAAAAAAFMAQRGARGRVAVSSTKGAVGHLLGAAGAVEAVFALLAVRDGAVPPTRNLVDLDAAAPVGVCRFPTAGEPARVRAALSNSFGFGGTNASLLFTESPLSP
jgi:3-oxoacyl-[acyl-carrier-protein] synthase II